MLDSEHLMRVRCFFFPQRPFLCAGLALLPAAFLAPACSSQPAPEPIAISAVQGAGAESPMTGRTVLVTGLVTARRSNGFYLQTPPGEDDRNEATSEGLFAFTSRTPPAEAGVGNRVRVSGTVAEYRPSADSGSPPLTQIIEPAVTLVSSGNALPPPVTLTPELLSPAGPHDQLERFENMRVHVPLLRVTAPAGGSVNEERATASSNGVFYGVLEGTPRPFREPGISVLDTLPASAPGAVPRFDTNPERLRVNSNGLVGGRVLDVPTNSLVRGLTGVLDYAFRAYSLLPDPGSPYAVELPPPFPVLESPEGREFSIASLNLERFFDDTDDPKIREPVLPPDVFARRLRKTALMIRERLHCPDILAVQEVENLRALEMLAARLNADAQAAGLPSPEYQAYLEEGNDPGGIDVGYLVKSTTVIVHRVEAVGREAVFTAPHGSRERIFDRPPFLLTAEVGGFRFLVINNHLRSLISIEELRVMAKRRAQAEYLASLVQANHGTPLAVIGDLNAFEFSDGYVDVVGTIRGDPAPAHEVVLASADMVEPDLVNLIQALPEGEAYTYVYNGDAQALDHVLVNGEMSRRLSRFSVARGNADAPETWRNDANRPERVSDHDAPMAWFRLLPPARQRSPDADQFPPRKTHR